jgi:hypothetical protein
MLADKQPQQHLQFLVLLYIAHNPLDTCTASASAAAAAAAAGIEGAQHHGSVQPHGFQLQQALGAAAVHHRCAAVGKQLQNVPTNNFILLQSEHATDWAHRIGPRQQWLAAPAVHYDS